MGMFNSILSRLIGNKKQKEAAEMLANMVNGDGGQDSPSPAESIKLAQGKANGFVQLSLTDESGEQVHSTTKIYGATQSLAGVMTAADKKKLDSIEEGSCGVNVVKFTWPERDQQCAVNFADLGIKDSDFICPVLDTGQGHFEMLPWQILSVQALYDTGELYATYKHNNTNYNLCISIDCEFPSEDGSAPPVITGVKLFWFDYMA